MAAPKHTTNKLDLAVYNQTSVISKSLSCQSCSHICFSAGDVAATHCHSPCHMYSMAPRSFSHKFYVF